MRASDQAGRTQRTRDEDLSSAFSEALDAQERALGEPNRDSRAARNRQQRRASAQSDSISTALDGSPPARPVPEDKPAASAGKTSSAISTSDQTATPPAGDEPDKKAAEKSDAQGAPAVADQPVTVAADPARPTPPAGAQGEAAVPVAAVPTVVPATEPAATGPEGASAVAAATASAQVAAPTVPAPQAAQPAQTAEAPAHAAPKPEVAQTAALKGDEKPEARVDTRAETRVEAKAEARVEARPAVHAEARAEVRAEAPPAAAPDSPAPQPPAPTAAGPLSFAGEVAQKVAAQTSAAGSVVPVHALAVTIAARASTGSTRFDIKLDPPELGRIEVQMTLDREGRVKSKLVVEKQETLDLLQRDQRNLERTLHQAGLDTSEGGIEFSLKDQGGQNAGGEQDQPARRWQARIEDPDAAATVQASAATYSRLAAARGGVDIRI